MINLLLGPPGAGKSYEAVVYHVLPALEMGRRVITNLPLNVDEIENRIPGASSLIEIRERQKGDFVPFQAIEHYGSDWRHEDGFGPLYVIDECHKPLPRGRTSIEVDEWFAEHRHEGADVLLITQSYGKVSKSIIDMVQNLYRVRKASALGSTKRYIRKVQDGIRGEVVNEAIRKYSPEHFALYTSHTKSNVAVNEAQANDIRPIWKNWSVIGAVLMIPMGLAVLGMAGNPMAVKEPDFEVAKPVAAVRSEPVQPAVPVRSTPVQPDVVEDEEEPEPDHPFSGLGLHVQGSLQRVSDGQWFYMLAASQNGQKVFVMTLDELRVAGYDATPVTPCLLHIEYGEFVDNITCDSPRQNVRL